jgi:potassium efflux system protein
MLNSKDKLKKFINNFADEKNGVEVKDRKWRLKNYKNCFVGEDATKWVIFSLIY